MKQSVLPPYQFLSDFLSAAKQAKHRIYLQAMLFESGTFLQQCEPIFIRKAQDGLEIHVTFDSIALQYVHENPNFFLMPTKVDKHYADFVHKQTTDLVKRWQNAGISFTITNPYTWYMHLFPIFRRNHIKIYAVDNTVWIGGINAFDYSLQTIDFMIPFTDPIIVQGVGKQFFHVNDKKPKRNYQLIAPNHTLLIDAGFVGNSLIYSEAIASIMQAKQEIIFCSPFIPDGKLLRGLVQKAKLGVKITVMTYPSGFPYNIHERTFIQQTKKYPNITLLYTKQYIHAKLLIVDTTVAIFGSHNFTTIGIMLGTEEIAIKTTKKELVASLVAFTRQYT